jgi:hypothetical protein
MPTDPGEEPVIALRPRTLALLLIAVWAFIRRRRTT